MRFLKAALFFVCLIACSIDCFASPGDRDPLYQSCFQACKRDCSILEQQSSNNDSNSQSINMLLNQNHKNLIIFVPAQTENEISLIDRLFDWRCPDLCQYDCMHAHTEWRQKRAATEMVGQDVVLKYYGKWPFKRLFGFQEFFSSIFSLLNMFPHMIRLIDYTAITALNKYSFRRFWILYGLVSINTWFWSAAFHARDRLLTERLDYYGASFGLIVSIIIQLIRTFHIQSIKQQFLIFFICLSAFCAHVGYLQFVHFDYGWNMKVSIISGVFFSGLCCITAFFENRSYRKQVWFAHFALWSAAIFEVFDFPPICQLLDAHAIWHGLTPPIVWLFWNITVKDSFVELEREKKLRSLPQSFSQTNHQTNGQTNGQSISEEQHHLMELGEDTDKLH